MRRLQYIRSLHERWQRYIPLADLKDLPPVRLHLHSTHMDCWCALNYPNWYIRRTIFRPLQYRHNCRRESLT